MKTINLACNNCGAPLKVPEGTRHLTCGHCNTQLQVEHSGGAYFTLLEKINERTEQAAGHLETITLQNELSLLDREFEMESRGDRVRHKSGSESEPSVGGSLMGGAIAVVGGLIFTITATQMGAPLPMSLFGILFMAAGLFMAFSGSASTGNYEWRKAQYQNQRKALLQKLKAKKSE